MGTGPRSREIARDGDIPWTRAALTWMVMMLVETGHGIAREVLLAPRVGSLHARQWGVLVGSVLVLLITLALSRWMKASTSRNQLVVGAFWVVLTVTFEFALGRAVGASWPRILSDYDLLHGGFMLLGLALMFAAPWLAARGLASWRR